MFLGDLAEITGGGTYTHILGHDFDRGLHLGQMTHGYDLAWGDAYFAHFHKVNPWLADADRHPIGRAIYSFEMCPDDVFEKSEFYNDWVRPNDDIIAGGSIAVARDRGQVFTVGACIRRKDREAVEGRFVEILNLLSQPLLHAWEASRQIASSTLSAMAGPGGAAGTLVAVVLDGEGKPRFSTPAAAAAMASGARLRITMTGRLRLADPAADLQLERVLLALRAGRAAWWAGPCAGGEITISGLPGGVAAEGAAGLILGAGAPCVLLALSDRAAVADAAILSRRLGLTRAEAEVALALAEGMTPAEIAEARGVSLHTVKNQIKAMASKCGVRRQVELVTLVIRARG